jgi:hypothetical protein
LTNAIATHPKSRDLLWVNDIEHIVHIFLYASDVRRTKLALWLIKQTKDYRVSEKGTWMYVFPISIITPKGSGRDSKYLFWDEIYVFTNSTIEY